jgi:hypothetical protein
MTKSMSNIATSIGIAGSAGLKEQAVSSRVGPVVRPDGSRAGLWGARILTAVPVLFLLFDGVIKLIRIPAVTETFQQLGWPVSLAVPIGILELACLIVFVIPPTAVLGALLLTAYLGGAVATHVRIGSPLVSHTLFPVYIGLFIWGALFLRDDRVRALIPLRR